ncbi:protein of unknown function [Burkholderia multivorans]
MQCEWAVSERADAQLRALEIEQHGDGPPGVPLDAADDLKPLLVLGVRTVTEVEPEHVGPGVEQGAYGVQVGARWPECGDDLGFTFAMHDVRSAQRMKSVLMNLD